MTLDEIAWHSATRTPLPFVCLSVGGKPGIYTAAIPADYDYALPVCGLRVVLHNAAQVDIGAILQAAIDARPESLVVLDKRNGLQAHRFVDGVPLPISYELVGRRMRSVIDQVRQCAADRASFEWFDDFGLELSPRMAK